MLAQADFAHAEFMAPFPDYKLPVSIVTESGFADKEFDASALARQSVRRDPQLPSILAFSPELVWPTLVQNGIALDLANSFLILVSTSISQKLDLPIFAWHFSTERSIEFCKETRFLRTDNGPIEVQYHMLAPGSTRHSDSRLLKFNVPEKTKYVHGRMLSQELIHIVIRDGWRIEEVGAFLLRYLHILGSICSTRDVPLQIDSANMPLPGEFVDFIPQNIVVGYDGSSQLIDKEWTLNDDISAGRLIFRSLLPLFHSQTRFGATSSDFINTPIGFFHAAFKAIGFILIDGEIESYAKLEIELQGEVAQQSLLSDELLNWLHINLLPRQNLNQAMVERDRQISILNQAVVERDGQITNLNQTVEHKEAHVSNLDAFIAEREEQIGAYHHAAIEREEIIRQIYNSRSWRLTKSIRFFSRLVRKTINLTLKLNPSNIKYIYKLSKPHLLTILRNPSIFKSKLYFFSLAWQSGGYRGVIQRLQHSWTGNPKTNMPSLDKSIVDFMRQLTSLPKGIEPAKLQSSKKISVIIPVYRGATETKRCIESVIKSTNLTSHNIIIINDCSPEPEVDLLLASYIGKYSHIQILKNDTNLGFVLTVNHGMRLSGNTDVILLNSDTEVSNDWLDRLTCQAYANDRIGTVTPLSNNATICNYPDLDGWPLLPDGETVSSIDKACSIANTGMSVDIPTAVGFCMYIKRDCLIEVGLFDEKAFGKGYGEENDFCLKATKKGWRHILATDIFVFHEGEISFSESAAAKKDHAMKVIRDRYPDYEKTIYFHIIQNAAYPYRVAATAARYRQDDCQVVLFISHTFGGGTEKHLQELADAISSYNAKVLFLRPFSGANGGDVVLEAHNKNDKLKVILSSQKIDLLAGVFKLFGVNKVHVHHTIGFGFSIEELVTSIGVPYEVTIHDFYSICPRINLITPKKGYCGSPSIDDCNACITLEPKVSSEVEIIWWRAKSGSLLNGSRNVYCPSTDTASRISAHFPLAPVRVVPHESIILPPARPASTRRKFKRFAILGVLSDHKGLSPVEEMLTEINNKNLPLEFVLIGYPERPLKQNRHLIQTGPYQDLELGSLIEKADPDAIFFTSRCPETYSYTLTAALLSGVAIIAPNFGAFPERIEGLRNAYVYQTNFSGTELINFLLSLKLNKNDQGIEEVFS
jgi:GT2 family glycosyltransferase